jgi:hypothetical protein
MVRAAKRLLAVGALTLLVAGGSASLAEGRVPHSGGGEEKGVDVGYVSYLCGTLRVDVPTLEGEQRGEYACWLMLSNQLMKEAWNRWVDSGHKLAISEFVLRPFANNLAQDLGVSFAEAQARKAGLGLLAKVLPKLGNSMKFVGGDLWTATSVAVGVAKSLWALRVRVAITQDHCASFLLVRSGDGLSGQLYDLHGPGGQVFENWGYEFVEVGPNVTRLRCGFDGWATDWRAPKGTNKVLSGYRSGAVMSLDRVPQAHPPKDPDKGKGAGAPETQITAGPAATTTNDFAKVYFKSATAGAEFQCRFDSGNWVACENPKAYSSVALGSHTVEVRASADGATDPSPATWSWTRVAADTTITAGPDGAVTRHDATIYFKSNESTDTSFQCRLDGGGWISCDNPKAYSQLSLGTHHFQVRAVVLGAEDPTPATWTWTVIPPDTQITAGPPNSGNHSATVYFRSPNDPDAGFQCRFDDAAWVPCTNPKAYSSIAKGTHTVSVRAVDLGAEDPTPATWTWKVS